MATGLMLSAAPVAGIEIASFRYAGTARDHMSRAAKLRKGGGR